MPQYDCTFILNPQLEESGFDGRTRDLIALIDKHGGKLIREDRMGMRRLAYEIDKLTQGYYISLVYEGSQELVEELEHKLRLDESCLRFLTCKAIKEPEPEPKPERKSAPAATAPAASEAAAAPEAPAVSEAADVEKPAEADDNGAGGETTPTE